MKPTLLTIAIALCCAVAKADEAALAGTQPLHAEGDLSAQMVAGISKFLDAETERSITNRQTYWHRDFSSPEAYERSIETNRNDLRRIIGAVDPRVPFRELELVSGSATSAIVADTKDFTVFAVRWPVFEDVHAEGLWVKPKRTAVAQVIAIPDADQTPEMLMGLAPGIAEQSQFARRLAQSGCEVLIPTLVNRDDTFSGNPKINRFTNQPHREWIYRQAFIMGRHIIGYEVQKVLAAVDFFKTETEGKNKIGVAGYGEGGLLALYAAALDNRINTTLVSGYFGSRQQLWQEPIYRNVFGLLEEFGDAEIASMILPRRLVIEYSEAPAISGPPSPHDRRHGAAPGKITTATYESAKAEFRRLSTLHRGNGAAIFVSNAEHTVKPGSSGTWVNFTAAFGLHDNELGSITEPLTDSRKNFDPKERQARQVTELSAHTQRLFRESERQRDAFVWRKLKLDSLTNYASSTIPLREYYRNEVIGNFTNAFLPLNPRSRKLNETDQFTEYEVMLDVYPDVFAWGYLLVPKNIGSAEHRQAVVCQHGLEGLPQDVVATDPKSEGFHYYQGFATHFAQKGYVVFAPHNPYRGADRFRELQRKANPLKKTLFSIIVPQHQQIVNWLSTLSFVDAKRIGFYGLSYGGKSAMRIPSLVDGYALSICSGDFNDWVQKNISLDFPASYMFTGEYEMPEFDIGNTFNYAEIAALIAPRPFMVERGHNDGVGKDSWVAFEYAKIRKLYDELGIGDRTDIEFFNGPHQIHGVGTYRFLDEKLK